MRVCVFCKTRYQKCSGITFHKFPINPEKQLWLQNMKISNWSPRPNDHLCSKHFTEDCFLKHASRTTLKNGSVPTFFSDTPLHLVSEPSRDGSPADQAIEMSPEALSHLSHRHADSVITNTVNTPVPDGMVTPTLCVSETSAGVKRKLTSSIDVYPDNTNFGGPSTSRTQKKFRTGPEVCKNIEHDHHYENTLPSTVSEVCINIRHDHRYENTPISSKKKLQHVKKCLKMSRSRVKVLSQHVKRLKIRVSSLKTVITELKRKKLIADDCANMLDQYHDFKPELFKGVLNVTPILLFLESITNKLL